MNTLPLKQIFRQSVQTFHETLILWSVSCTMLIYLCRNSGEDSLVSHIENGLIVLVTLGKYFPENPLYDTGCIRCLLKKDGIIIDRFFVCGLIRMYNCLNFDIVPMAEYLAQRSCKVTVVDYIGCNRKTSLLKNLLTHLANHLDRGVPMPRNYVAIAKYSTSSLPDLCHALAMRQVKLGTYLYSYTYLNLIRYVNPLLDMIHTRRTNPQSLYNICKYHLLDNMEGDVVKLTFLRFHGLPNILVADLLECVIHGRIDRRTPRTLRLDPVVSVNCRRLGLNLQVATLKDVLDNYKGMTLNCFLKMLTEMAEINYAFIRT